MRMTTSRRQEAKAHLLRSIQADHAVLAQALSDLSRHAHVGDAEAMRTALGQVEQEILGRFEAEEELVLCRFAGAHLADAVLLRQEHVLIRQRLGDLGTALGLRQLRGEMVDAFAALLEAHVMYEERVMYTWADEFLPLSQRHALSDWFLARVQARLGRREPAR